MEVPTEGTGLKIGSFTPQIFVTNSGMGAECNYCFLKRLAM